MSESLLLDFALKSGWMMERGYLQKTFAVLTRHASGKKLTAEEIKAAIGDKGTQPQLYTVSPEGVATIAVYGVICKRASWIQNISGPSGNACDSLRTMIGEAMKDEKVKSIVLDVDSPGGTVDGVADLTDYIYSLRGQKPITAFANGQMCSAAYFIASACDKIVASQDAEVGSIGVYCILADYSEALKEMGIKEEMIKSGKFKGASHPDFPISDEARKLTQSAVDAHYANFVQAVARNRGMKFEDALKVADGRYHVGAKAKEMGLVDAIGTFQSVGGTTSSASTAKASTSSTPSAAVPGASPVATPVSASTHSRRGRENERRSQMSKENAPAPAEGEEILLVEASPGDVKKYRPALYDRIGRDFIAAENDRIDNLKGLVARSGLKGALADSLVLKCKGLSIEEAQLEIGRVSVIEAALASAETIHGLNAEDVKALRADVEGLGQHSAVQHISSFLNAKKGAATRQVTTTDPATTGKDSEKPPEGGTKSTLAETVKEARAEFKQVENPLGMLKEAEFVGFALREKKIEATEAELKAVAPDLFK